METATKSIVERYAHTSPGDFRKRIERSWVALDAVKETVVDQVESDNLSPLEGVGVIGCAAAQIFGYNAFHGQTTPADLVASVITQQQRERAQRS
jgi:hypothetical protein